MKFGVTFPNSWGIEDPSVLFALGTKTEELGYDSLWTSEHVFNVSYVGTRLGDAPYYDSLLSLTHVAAITKSIRLGTSVLVLPYHHPVALAKQLATLDVFCGGRLDIGIGAGVIEEEFRALGADFSQRGAVTDESIQAMKALWTQELPQFEGRHYSFSGMVFSPKPMQRPHPPIYVGGDSHPAVRRAAREADVWHPTSIGAEDLRLGMRYLHEQARLLGRDPEGIGISVRLDLDFPALGGTRTAPRHPRPSLSGTPGEVIEQVRVYDDLGVDELLLATNSRDASIIGETIETFAREVVPAFRH